MNPTEFTHVFAIAVAAITGLFFAKIVFTALGLVIRLALGVAIAVVMYGFIWELLNGTL